jgi:hypothetical protein
MLKKNTTNKKSGPNKKSLTSIKIDSKNKQPENA